MKRVIFCTAMMAALSDGAVAQTSGDRDRFRDRGTTLPRTLSSDPMGSPYATGVMGSGTSLGSTATLPREVRREHDARIQFEQDDRDRKQQAWRAPPLRFDIPQPDRPKPNAE